MYYWKNKKKFILACLGIIAILGVVAVVGLSPFAKAAFCQRMSIPAYFYPGALWNQATSGAPTVQIMIMNPASGPGNSQNQDYVAAVANARAAGIKVIGYSHTSYGSRDIAVVKAEIDVYKQWYGVDGIFLDEVSSDVALIPYYQELADYIRASAGTYVMLNPGTIPAEGYMNVGDTVVIFEGTYSAYLNWQMPGWAINYAASKFSHLVYGSSNTTRMKRAINLSHQRRAGYVYVTNDVLPNPWDTLPSYWSAELTELNKSCGI